MGRAIADIMQEHHELQEKYGVGTDEYWRQLRKRKKEARSKILKKAAKDNTCPSCGRKAALASTRFGIHCKWQKQGLCDFRPTTVYPKITINLRLA